jgi:hypothetical protein
MYSPLSPSGHESRARILSLGILSATGLAIAPTSSLSQTPQATQNIIRQMESTQRELAAKEQQTEAAAKPAAKDDEVPETYPGENADLGPQMLLKQKAPQRKPLFEFSNDTMFSWTSNALGGPHSQGNARQDTGTVAETVSLAIAPEPISLSVGKLALRAGYRHLLFMYDASDNRAPLNAQNFQMSTLFMGANLTFKENWNASLGLDYNRLLFSKRPWSLGNRSFDPSNWSEGYTEFKPNWSLSRNIGLAEKLNLSLSYSGAYHFSNTDAVFGDDKDYSRVGDNIENGISASLMWAPVEKLLLIPSYRFTYYNYTHSQRGGGHRQDRTMSPNITAMYVLSQRASIRLSASSDFRHSSQAMNSGVRKYDLGLGFSLSLKF